MLGELGSRAWTLACIAILLGAFTLLLPGCGFIEDLFEDPQLNAGDSLVAVHLPDGRQTKLPRLPLALDLEIQLGVHEGAFF